jgi:transketolase C-terminal domain/subunit
MVFEDWVCGSVGRYDVEGKVYGKRQLVRKGSFIYVFSEGSNIKTPVYIHAVHHIPNSPFIRRVINCATGKPAASRMKKE